jgi:glycosyltransferase involved in cell wall biosynthesis
VTPGADPQRGGDPAAGAEPGAADAAGTARPPPEVSVVTVSSGRVDLVRRKLAALARQTAGAERLELVLVDNACPDRVGDVAEAVASPFGVRVLRSDRRLTAAAARAWAAREARGRWLWWSDDDVVPDEGAMAAHLAAQAQRPGVTIGGVRFVTAGGSARWRPRRPGPAHLTGVNSMLLRADHDAIIETLPELPRPYGGEDTLVGLALQARGVAFSAVADAWVDHHGPSPTAADDDAKAYDSGYNAAVLVAWYPSVAWALGLHPLQVALKRVALPFLAWTGPWLAGDLAYLRGARDARQAGIGEPGTAAATARGARRP